MEKCISVIGGDLRNVKLVESLANDGFNVAILGLEKAEILKSLKNVTFCMSIQEATKNNVIVSSMPFSSNNMEVNTPLSDHKIAIEELVNNLAGKILIAGSIKNELIEQLKSKKIKLFDLLDREELAILNAISTSEGAIQIAMENTLHTLHGSEILVLGFGRIGKVLAKMLTAIGAKVTCAARKHSDIAWIKTYGYNPVTFDNLNETLKQYDIIMNTVPKMVLDKDRLIKLKQECLIIDLASKPGGINQEAAENLKLKTIWALALPGKVAPTTSAEYMKETIYNILKEEGIKK